jgi:hypothetical protein
MFRTCRATPDEVRRSLPGDDLVSDPLCSATHAITIQASADQVWPWLAQMGAGRAGWYSMIARTTTVCPALKKSSPNYSTWQLAM